MASARNAAKILLCLHVVFFSAASTVFEASTSPEVQQRIREARELQERGELEEANQVYASLVPTLRRLEDLESLKETLDAMSRNAISTGQYSLALTWAGEAADIHRGLADLAGEAESEYDMGVACLYLGDYPAALEHYRRALDLDRKSGNVEGEVLRLNDIANVKFYVGEYFEALRLYQEALEILAGETEREWQPRQRRLTLHNLAVLYQKLGLNDKALELYVELRETPGLLSPSEEAQLLTNLGVLYRHLGDPVKALECYRRAREQFVRERYVVRELGALRNIGILMALDLGDLEEAEKAFREVVRLADQSSNLRNVVHGHLYLGEVERRLGRLSQARREFDTARRGAVELGVAEEEWKSLYGLALIAEAEGFEDESIGYLEDAIDVIESVRSRLRLSSLKPGFLANKRDVYGSLIALRAGEGSGNSEAVASEVFNLMETARARTFRDQMRTPLQRLMLERHPEEARSLAELRAELAAVWRRQLDLDAAGRVDLQKRFNELENRYLVAESQLADLLPEPSVSGITLGETQQLLDDSTLLVEIWVGERFLSVVWLTGTEAGVLGERLDDGFANEVDQCLEKLGDSSSKDWKSACEPLNSRISIHFDSLLTPGIQTIVLVADQVLTVLPFEALSLPGGEYLIERVNVHYLPSASLLTAPDKGSLVPGMPWSTCLVAFGDPLIPGTETSEVQERWQPLPYSAGEVMAVANQLSGRENIYLGVEAQKKHLFEEETSKSSVIHLSTHAVVDMENSDRSRILFSPDEAVYGANYLFLGEVLNLELTGNSLVTLSACDTARGKLVSGEGIQNFSRAFLLSGAGATVTSLWKVADQPTAEFMKQFYHYLGQGNTKTEALRSAKISFLESKSPLSHPYYWGAFVLHGDGRSPVHLPLSWTTLLFAAGISALLVGLILTKVTFCEKSEKPVVQGSSRQPKRAPY